MLTLTLSTLRGARLIEQDYVDFKLCKSQSDGIEAHCVVVARKNRMIQGSGSGLPYSLPVVRM